MSSINETILEVDENNEPIGVISKFDAHAEGVWHRTVHIYYIKKNKDGFNFLAHHRSKDKDLHPNSWDARFGGHVKYKQNIDDAVKCEMREEIGISIKMEDLIEGQVRRVVSQSKKNREFSYVFYYFGDEDETKLSFNEDEVEEVRWMTMEEIQDEMIQEPDMWAGNLKEFDLICEELVKLSV